MNTPIFDFINNYNSAGTLRTHTPGHKGIPQYADLAPLYHYDITEISGADSLFEADGIIAESEKNMSSLYNTAGTVYSATGSTLCIQAMLAIMKMEQRRVIAVRNVHRSFLNTAALLDLDVEWSVPEYTAGLLSGKADLADLEAHLQKSDAPACIYLTSPDYTGALADIPAISALCRKYDARLIVDNAHGAHLAFMPENLHPIALGADMCCDSAHKMLPALTGAAMLHTSRPEYASQLKSAMSLFAGTSPSYLVMASLDLCNKYISEHIREDINRNLAELSRFRELFNTQLTFVDGEPFHITIKAAESGYDGMEFAQALRENGVECEYSDSSLVVLLMSPVYRSEDYKRLYHAVSASLKTLGRSAPVKDDFSLTLPKRAMSIREAVFSTSEDIDVENSEGRICGAVRLPCPPAVPIAASGEIIDQNCINIFKRYGIRTVNVVK